jgi:hypothetical protein
VGVVDARSRKEFPIHCSPTSWSVEETYMHHLRAVRGGRNPPTSLTFVNSQAPAVAQVGPVAGMRGSAHAGIGQLVFGHL